LIERTFRRGDRVVDLLPREFRLLEYMRSVTDTTILFEKVWNYNFVPASNLVDVHMGRLRHKVDGPDERRMIHNVRGVGLSALRDVVHTMRGWPTTASSPPWLVTYPIARNYDGQGYPARSFLNHAQVLGIG
jgi:DNA-binding winged helix-turn-helix (wHTH) protein